MSIDLFDRSRIKALAVATLVEINEHVEFETLVDRLGESIDPHVGIGRREGPAWRAVRSAINELGDEGVLTITAMENILDKYMVAEKGIERSELFSTSDNYIVAFGSNYPVFIDLNADAFSSACAELGVDPTPALNQLVQRQSSIPAADRWVSLDHNSAAVEEVSKGLRNLQHAIETSNEAGEIFGDQREAVVAEVSALRAMWAAGLVRAEAAKRMARTTLGWIGKAAAESLVGALALALLGKMMGILG